MFRTALRLGTLPLFAALLVWVGVGVPLWQWIALAFFSPFILGLLLLSYWRLKSDPLQGAVPLWAQKLSPYVWGVCIVVMLSVPLTSWRLHSAFNLAQPHLEQLRIQAQAGHPAVWPQRAGEFEILDVYIEDEEITFYLDDGGPPTALIYSVSSRSVARDIDLSANVVTLSDNWIYYEPSD